MVWNWLDDVVRERPSDLGRCEYAQVKGEADSSCQGEGRGFESRGPLRVMSQDIGIPANPQGRVGQGGGFGGARSPRMGGIAAVGHGSSKTQRDPSIGSSASGGLAGDIKSGSSDAASEGAIMSKESVSDTWAVEVTTDQIEESPRLRDRRGLLLGLAAGAGGLVAGALAGSQPAGAGTGDGGDVQLGLDNTGAKARTGVFYTNGTINEFVATLGDPGNTAGVYGQDNSSVGGYGVSGDSAKGNGVYGQSAGGDGVYGSTTGAARSGVVGEDNSSGGGGNGVYGHSDHGNGVVGISNDGIGVSGESSESGPGVFGTAASGAGVSGQGGPYGRSWGVAGQSVGPSETGLDDINSGVWGDSASNIGVWGTSDSSSGVRGDAINGEGVTGNTYGNGHSGVAGSDGSTLGGNGAFGHSNIGVGVRGESGFPPDGGGGYGGAGVAGIYVESSSIASTHGNVGVWGDSKAYPGVLGTSDTAPGVTGLSSSGAGVLGEATSASGVGVSAQNTTGTALQVEGAVTFTRSGLVTAAGTVSAPITLVTVTVPGAKLTAASIVFTAVQGGPVAGVAIASAYANPGTNIFRIHLTAALTTSMYIAWFVLG